MVSVFKGWYVMNSLHAAASRTVGEEVTLQLSVIPGLRSSATLLLDPLVAKQLKEIDGFESKQDFARWISKNALIPNGRFWGTDTIDMLVAPLGQRRRGAVRLVEEAARRRAHPPLPRPGGDQHRGGRGRDEPGLEDHRLRLLGLGAGGLLAAGRCVDAIALAHRSSGRRWPSSALLPAGRSLTIWCSASSLAGSMVWASATSATGGLVPVRRNARLPWLGWFRGFLSFHCRM